MDRDRLLSASHRSVRGWMIQGAERRVSVRLYDRERVLSSSHCSVRGWMMQGAERWVSVRIQVGFRHYCSP